MKYLNKDTTIEEANEIIKDGLKETGFILTDKRDIKFIVELTYNLNQYLTYFIAMADLYDKEEDNNI